MHSKSDDKIAIVASVILGVTWFVATYYYLFIVIAGGVIQSRPYQTPGASTLCPVVSITITQHPQSVIISVNSWSA